MEVMLKRMQWMLTLRLNTFLLFTTPHNHTHKVFLIDVLISHTLPNSLSSMSWDLALQPFFNLAISFMNPAGYWKFYPVPVLVEHAHVKEREHEKHVVQTAKSAMYLNPGTSVPRHAPVVLLDPTFPPPKVDRYSVRIYGKVIL